MLNDLKALWLKFYYGRCAVYPPKWWWPIIRIFGGQDGLKTGVYMTRVVLSPKTRWGQLYLHVFHREDLDRDPHDHPFAFWTLPLNQGYTEEVFRGDSACFFEQRVPHFRWSYRPAVHCHRIISADHGWPLVTLVWRGGTERAWGFWTHSAAQVAERPTDPTRFKTPWQDYVYSGSNANIDGADNVCPGVPSIYRKSATQESV